MDCQRPFQPPITVTILSRRHAPATSARDPTNNTQYTKLGDHLTDPQYRLADIRIHLNDQRLTDAEARKLFGSIRKSVLDAILQHRGTRKLDLALH